MNESKLDINKMALGLQYAGNIANDSGVSFEELTAAFGATANAGIRSGSTWVPVCVKCLSTCKT